MNEKHLAGCDSTCSLTYDMLIESEEPTTIELSNGIFGANNGEPQNRPGTSICSIPQ